jgi:hypothetical protein
LHIAFSSYLANKKSLASVLRFEALNQDPQQLVWPSQKKAAHVRSNVLDVFDCDLATLCRVSAKRCKPVDKMFYATVLLDSVFAFAGQLSSRRCGS